MDEQLLARADEIVASLSPGKQEMVREIVINSVRRGAVDASAARYLTAASGSTELADTLTAAIAGVDVHGQIGDGGDVPKPLEQGPSDT